MIDAAVRAAKDVPFEGDAEALQRLTRQVRSGVYWTGRVENNNFDGLMDLPSISTSSRKRRSSTRH